MIKTYIKPPFKYFNLTEKGVNAVMDEPGLGNNSDKVNRFSFFEKCENTITSFHMNCIIDDLKKEFIEGVAALGDNTSLIKKVLSAPEKNGINPEDKLMLCRKNTEEKEELTILYGCPMALAAYMGDNGLMNSLKAAGFDWRVNDCVEVINVSDARAPGKEKEIIGYLKLRNPDFALIFLELSEAKRDEIMDEMYSTEHGPLIFGEEIITIISSNRHNPLGYYFKKHPKNGNGDRHCIINIRKAVNEIIRRNEECYEPGKAPVYVDISSVAAHVNGSNTGGYNMVREYDFGIGTAAYFYEVEARRMVIPFLKLLNRGEYSLWKDGGDYRTEFYDPFGNNVISDVKTVQGIRWESEDELFEKLLSCFVGRGDRYSLNGGLMSGVSKLCDTDAKKACLIKTELVHISGSLLFTVEEEMEREVKSLRRIIREWKWNTIKMIDEVWEVTEIEEEEPFGFHDPFAGHLSGQGFTASDLLRLIKTLRNAPVTLSAKSEKAMNLMCNAYMQNRLDFFEI
ncbi:MAG: hypothetical protein IKO61_03900 [Lachnospiraceae bacterium]|nr:hypothetical protein [Lachnospiraceae bacterium]